MENSKVDIFKEGKEVQAGWAQFKNVGDKVQGTYIKKFEQKSQKYNQDQIIYVLKDGQSLINVGFNKSKIRLHQKFDALKFGQIIGIEYVGTREGLAGGNPQKVYKIVANPEIVDNEWVENQKNIEVEETSSDSESESQPEEEVAPSAADVFEEMKDQEEAKVSKIAELAISKLNVKTRQEVMDKVMEATNIPFAPANYDKIITALEAL